MDCWGGASGDTLCALSGSPGRTREPHVASTNGAVKGTTPRECSDQEPLVALMNGAVKGTTLRGCPDHRLEIKRRFRNYVV